MTSCCVDLGPLDHASPTVRARIGEMLDGDHPHFVLIGTDPGDAGGCCPSDDVGEALRLARSGVLQAHHPPVPENACPSTVFACAGEIDTASNPPSFTPDPELRARIRARLDAAERRQRRQRLLGRALLAFVLVVLVVGGVRLALRGGTRAPDHRLLDVPAEADLVMAAFFHKKQRCPFCRTLEAGLREALAQPALADRGVVIRMLVTDDPAVRRFEMEQGGFASGIVMLALEDGRVVRSRLLVEAYEHTNEPAALAESIAQGIEDFLAE